LYQIEKEYQRMAKKYISQQISNSFVYPNNELYEYDQEIIHNINNNMVSGSVTNFTATLIDTNDIQISFDYVWQLGGAVRQLLPSDPTQTSVLSVHMLAPNQKYFKPWICVLNVQSSNITGSTISGSVTAVPDVPYSLTNGVYTFEFRFISERSIYPIIITQNVVGLTPTPTPTPTITPTPSVTPTHTPPSPSVTPTHTPTSTTTPTPTPVFTTLSVYSGTSSTVACNETYATTIYYTGSLVTGTTIFWDSPALSNQVPNGYYLNASNGQVYVVTGSDGRLASITSCPAPTPTPTPSPAPVSVGGYITVTYGSNTSGGSGSACSSSNSVNIYYKTGDPAQLTNNQYYYTSAGYAYDGSSQPAYSDANLYGPINSSGKFTSSGTCL
jgi:hypothetical protein